MKQWAEKKTKKGRFRFGKPRIASVGSDHNPFHPRLFSMVISFD